MGYEDLLSEADKNGIYVIERADFKSNLEGLNNGRVIDKGRTTKRDSAYFINKNILSLQM